MRYKPLGNTGLEVSILGFGCMRLPEKEGKVIRGISNPLLRRAVDLGINYFDTAIDYCSGDSQAAVGEALEGVREKVILSTKNHHHRAGKAQWRRHLEDSLKLLRTDYIDIYNHHGISWSVYENYLNPEIEGLTLEMIRAKEEGLIGHLAFSFHDTPENLIKLIDTGYYESVTLQYNLLDQRNKDAIAYADERGMGVVIMGPVGGGRLGLPSTAISKMAGGEVSSTPEAALRFVWGTPGVDIALSGMQNMEMLEENVSIADRCDPFSQSDVDKLNRLVGERKKKSGLYCTGCNYCIPKCPRGVAIPDNLDLLNLAAIYDLPDTARERYQHLKGKASECIDCGKCVAICPQQIDIPKRMREAAMLFDEDANSIQYGAFIEELAPEGSFGLVLKIFNFSETARSASVQIIPADGTEIKPDLIEIENMPPFSRISRRVDGSFAPQADAVAFTIESRYGGEITTIEKECRFAFLYKDAIGRRDDGAWYTFRPAAADFTDNKDTVSAHGVSFKLSYTEAALILHAEVRDDFLFPTIRKKHTDEVGDCLELFLNGAYRIFLYPGTPGKARPFYKAPRTDMKIKLHAEAAGDGYRLKAEIPFSSFCEGETPPRKIDFDLACNTANRNGVRIGRFFWIGNSQPCEFWLV